MSLDYTIVKKIIKERFSLGDEGFSMFEKNLNNSVQEYSFLKEDNRASFKIDKSLHPFLDDGYKLLCGLKTFVRKYSISFDNYSENKVLVGSNSIKIFKVALEFYTKILSNFFEYVGIPESEVSFDLVENISSERENEYVEIFKIISKYYKPSEKKEMKEKFNSENDKTFESLTFFVLTKVFEKIGCYKLNFSKDLFFVISTNFNDFFLCSNGEGWTSCLNPESPSGFWSSLPFLTADKNRCLCFISDLSEKEYLGIKSLRMFKRGWGELDRNKIINTGIFYPAKEYLEDSFFEKMDLSHKIRSISSSFYSRYPIDLFFNKYSVFDFLYQDDTKFTSEENRLFLRRGSKNHTIILQNGGSRDYHMCSYKEGLTKLIEENKEISSFPGIRFCEECFSVVDNNKKISYTLIDGTEKKTCFNCLIKYIEAEKVLCNCCKETLGKIFNVKDSRTEYEKQIISCPSCTICGVCGKHFSIKEAKECRGEFICNECFSTKSKNEEHSLKKRMFESTLISFGGLEKAIKMPRIREAYEDINEDE